MADTPGVPSGTGNVVISGGSTRRSTEYALEGASGSASAADIAAQYRDIVRMCWRQRELKRPRAESVHKRLLDLIAQVWCGVLA
jgi:hypothetical protein